MHNSAGKRGNKSCICFTTLFNPYQCWEYLGEMRERVNTQMEPQANIPLYGTTGDHHSTKMIMFINP